MATPTYSINDGSTIHGVRANWRRVVKRKNADGSIDFEDYAIHTWEIEQMTMALALELQALAGQTLTSLATTDIDDRNNGATYTEAEITNVPNFEHRGQRALGLRLEFRVKI